ncbi:serine hydrolase domain-containing protein [Phenylobacterium sp.]|uniref:serine hydrolase domain-containing protein n=1 Tax=Phenylobacterium sp. TaxID=1871053 RepID=UPI00286D41DB|nr:serine hydrolase domain-containing protein [Phenylobacterium sp.]
MDHPITKALEKYVDADELAGAAALVWRDGRVQHAVAVGWRDMDAMALMTRDTIFRIASMTKPVTSTAALMLIEEGAFALDDPISRWAPEFSQMRVLRSPTGPLDDTDAANREITFDDLLTHRSGITYGDFHAGPIAAAYFAALGSDIDSHLSPDDWIAALAALPLIDQPGAGFHYGHSTHLLGLLIARIEGAPLSEVLQRRIFAPLGMKDTGFTVPVAKHERRAQMYGFDAAGRIIPRPLGTKDAGALLAERSDDMTNVSGGGGLWSTLDDYLAFARMFVGEGSVDGVRLLKPETLALMTANHLTEDQRARGENFGMPLFTAHGFGLGLAVVMDPETAAVTRCKGGVGTVGWPGAYGGWWQADPTDGSVMIFLAHNIFELEQLAQGIGLAVYGAITEFHGLASA